MNWGPQQQRKQLFSWMQRWLPGVLANQNVMKKIGGIHTCFLHFIYISIVWRRVAKEEVCRFGSKSLSSCIDFWKEVQLIFNNTEADCISQESFKMDCFLESLIWKPSMQYFTFCSKQSGQGSLSQSCFQKILVVIWSNKWPYKINSISLLKELHVWIGSWTQDLFGSIVTLLIVSGQWPVDN